MLDLWSDALLDICFGYNNEYPEVGSTSFSLQSIPFEGLHVYSDVMESADLIVLSMTSGMLWTSRTWRVTP